MYPRVGQVYREKRNDNLSNVSIVIGVFEDWVYLGDGWRGNYIKLMETHELIGELAYYTK